MKKQSSMMNPTERRAVFALGGIFGLRMFGLFLILPVFVLYAEELAGTTPLLVGITLGVYGLTQALLQIPYGLASDRLGRKPVIAAGLLVFIVGSVIAALGDHILTVLLGRAIQGAGAIAAAVLALTADLTREQQRTKAMAMIGVSIGFAFMLALILAPILQGIIGVSGLFWMTAVLAGIALVVLWWLVPTPVRRPHCDVIPVPAQIVTMLKRPDLLRLDISIFVLHLILTAMFVVVPVMLVRSAGINLADHWQVYVPVMVLSVLAMIPLMILSTRKDWMKPIFVLAVGILLAAQLVLGMGGDQLWVLVFGLWAFFWGFNTLEALLPSLVSRVAPAASKGTAVGIYNTFQFSGVFLGGLLGGWLSGYYGATAVFYLCFCLIAVWMVVMITAKPFRLLDSHLLRVDVSNINQATSLAQDLELLEGVEEAVVIIEEKIAYLKLDPDIVDFRQLDRFTSDELA